MIIHLWPNTLGLILFYNLFLRLYLLGIRTVSPWNQKARLWIRGRKAQQSLKQPLFGNKDKVIWMHCASLGEFEQGRPVMEELKRTNPEMKVLLTFFSPSGFEVRKDYEGADKVLYLPLGTSENARSFINMVNPSLVLWVKYEYWYYYLVELKRRNIPVILFSAIFREEQPFFKWYGSLHIEMLKSFRAMFVQDQNSVDLLKTIGITENIVVAGDTRFDRVIQIAESSRSIPLVEAFIGENKCIVAGSTWLDDEEELVHFAKANPDIRFVLAPHHVEEERIKEIEKLFPSTIRYSQISNQDNTRNQFISDQENSYSETLSEVRPDTPPGSSNADPQTLIIDNIGMLSTLYRYGTVCYVGGGFGDDGVHNVLEAAVYGKPVVFGPVYEKYREALELVNAGGGFPVSSALQLEETMDDLINDHSAGELAGKYVYNNSGATAKILDQLKLLIN
jgi:3-deoxy-D-manno-octulosonic-acid transferase